MAQQASSHIPEGLHSVTPHLWFNGDCREAIGFYQKALGAELQGNITPRPDSDEVWHAMLKIGNSVVMLADADVDGWEHGPDDGTTASLWIYVEDCDALFEQAVENGCTVMVPLMDAFWGDRMGKLKDPYGHSWAIATYQWVYSPGEMQEMMQQQSSLMEEEETELED